MTGRPMRTAGLALVIAGSLFGQGYTISTFAGLGLPVNVAADSVSVGVVGGVAVDAAGNAYFTSGSTVLRIDAATRILTLVAGTGTPGFSGDGGPATAAQLNQPNAIALDSAGNIYIGDYGRIREVSNGTIATIAGTGTPGTSGDNGPAIGANVAPLGLAVDSAGNLYLTDAVTTEVVTLPLWPGKPAPLIFGSVGVSSGTVRKISNGVITTIAGTGLCCAPTADNVPATSVPLYEPAGIAVDSAGNLYVACSADPENTGLVRKISNGVISTVAGGGSPSGLGNGPATSVNLLNLGGLALDSAGNLFVADQTNNEIREISGGTITAVAGYGPSGYGGDGGPATGARLNEPQGIAVDSGGNLYIADYLNYAIREVSNGLISTAAGNGFQDFSGDNGPATAAQFFRPYGVAADTSGNLYIADSNNSRIRKVSNGTVTTVAGNGGASYGGDNGPATSAVLFNPQGVALDAAGNLYIADTDNGRVRKVSNGVIATVAGGGSGANGFGDGGPATSAFLATPLQGVAVDSAGNIYITDISHSRIREVSNGIVATVAGTGTAGYIGDGGLAVNAELNGPAAIAVDSAGNLYIADGGNYRVRKVSGGIITTVAGSGISGSSGDGGPATGAQLDYPAGIALDAAGNLYIADVSRIRVVSGGTIATIAGNGTMGFSGDNVPATSAEISSSGIAVDSAGNVYFSEPGANRIRLLRPNAGACTTFLTQTTVIVDNAGGSFSISVGANGSCTWTVQGLPSWIAYSGSGVTGPATISLTVAPNTGAARTAVFTVGNVSVTVTQESQLTIATSSPLAAGTIGAAYSQSLAAGNGLGPYAWSLISGALPPGLTLSSSGAISGTPSAPGIYNFTILVTDGASALTSLMYNLTVIAAGGATPAGSVVTHALPTVSQDVFIDASGNVYSATFAVGQATVTPGAAQPYPGASSCSRAFGFGPCTSAYITKADSNGNLVVATLLGGATATLAYGVTADAAGNIYVIGSTDGSFPVTPDAAITTQLLADAFAAKLSADGSKFLYATYLHAGNINIAGGRPRNC